MNSIDNFFDKQGEYGRKIIEAFFLHGITDVLNYAYELENIEQYLETEKDRIRNELLIIFKNRKKYVFRDTDEEFRLTDDFFYYTFDFEGDLPKFKRHLEKASAKQLNNYFKIIFEEDLLLEKDRLI